MQPGRQRGLALSPAVVMGQAFTPARVAIPLIAGALAPGLSTVDGLPIAFGPGIYTTPSSQTDDRRKMKMGPFFVAFGGVVTIFVALRPPEFLLTSFLWAYVASAPILKATSRARFRR